MRKTISMVILALLAVSMVMAAGSNAGQEKPEGTPEPMLLGSGSGNGSAAAVAVQNAGEDSQIQSQERVRELISENGAMLRVEAAENSRAMLKAGGSEAHTGLELVQSENRIQAKLSNGQNAEIKVMPDAASERALERLRIKVCSAENACQIELKETGKGDQIKAAYEIQIERHSRILGIFQAKMQVKAQVDAENGEVVKVSKPWWAFLAAEPEE